MKTIFLTLLVSISSSCFAQVTTVSNVDSIQLDESKDLQLQLVPLDSIISIALRNSASVKFQQDIIEASEYQVEYVKREWTNNIAAYGNYATGNQSLVTADSDNPTVITNSSLSNGYQIGLKVTVPLYNFVGHKSRVNLYKATLQSNIDKRDDVKQTLVNYLVELYYKLIYAQNLVSIRSDAKESAINQYKVAQQEFKDGIIAAAELSRLKTVEVDARVDFEDARRLFATYYQQFQTVVGVPVKQLIRHK